MSHRLNEIPLFFGSSRLALVRFRKEGSWNSQFDELGDAFGRSPFSLADPRNHGGVDLQFFRKFSIAYSMVGEPGLKSRLTCAFFYVMQSVNILTHGGVHNFSMLE